MGHYDEPKTLSYAIPLICPIGADVKQSRQHPEIFSGSPDQLTSRLDRHKFLSFSAQREQRLVNFVSSAWRPTQRHRCKQLIDRN